MVNNANSVGLAPESARFLLWAFDLTEHVYVTVEKEMGLCLSPLRMTTSAALLHFLEDGPQRSGASSEKGTLLYLVATSVDLATAAARQPGHAYHEAARLALPQLAILRRTLETGPVDARPFPEESPERASRIDPSSALLRSKYLPRVMALATVLSGKVRVMLGELAQRGRPSVPIHAN